MQSKEVSDVVVIGSGVVGAFAAFYAIKNQLKVTVLERNIDVTMGSTNANSGIVHAGYNTAPGTLKAKFVDLGNKIIDELSGPLNFTYSRCGALVVARTDEDNPAIDKMVAYSKEQGIPVEVWDEERLRKEEPHLAPNIKRALHAPTAGVVIPYELTLATMQSCTASGVDLRLDREVRAIKKVDGGYEIHAYNVAKLYEEVYQAKVVINAAGLFADKIAEMVDPQTPIKIKPRRGEEYLCKKDAWSLVKHIIFPVPNKVSKGTLVIPSADGRLMIGPTADEIDDPMNRDTTASGYKRVMEAVQSMVPAITPQMIVANFAGVRAADVNGDFVINEKDGFINLAGMQSPALTAAPAIGEFVCKEFLSKHFDLKPNGNFKLVPFKTRFHRADLALKNEYVKSDANYARVVCMCEMVTEADIHNAITEGARSLDGIKFRTRMGMGDCQGGFCTTKAIQLLSERLGVDQNQITKRGRGTEMIANSYSEIGGNEAVSEYHPITDAKPLLQTMDVPAMEKLLEESYADILIIGAGPAGLGAGLAARKQDSSKSVLLLDRCTISGGILRQCIHSGFGLKRYKKELTGPEYAEMLADEAVEAGCHILLSCVVLGSQRDEDSGTFTVNCMVSGIGLKKFRCKSLITAAGCRERTRPEVRIAGPRPSGVYTAGLAQMMINIRGQVPKGRVVILGSGDIGLIMARRCTLEGMQVLGVYELLPLCSGLRRNVIQCLEDFNIPLHLSKTVVEVVGRDRLQAVKIAKVDPKTLVPDLTQTETIECEYLILSVGLLQQVKLVVQTGGVVDMRSRGCKVDGRCEVKDGAFAVGNCLTVHDLADDAVEEGQIAGTAAAARLSEKGQELNKQMQYAPVEISDQVVFIVPHQICVGPAAPARQHLAMRVRKPMGSITLKAFYGEDEVGQSKVNEAVPAEMIHIRLNARKLEEAWQKDKNQKVSVKIIQNPADLEEAPGMQNATCTICPNSCTVWGRVDENGQVVDIHGNTCPRGAKYIQAELTHPVRTISMAVALEGSRVANRITVKPDRDIPKERVLELAEHCRKMKVKVGVRMGQCVEEKVLGGLCNMISCSTVLE